MPCFLLLLFALLLSFAPDVQAALWEGLVFCGRTLIPALFPFLVLCDLLCVYRAQAFVLPRRLRQLLWRFGLPDATPLLLGWLCGFPTGAKCVYSLFCDGILNKEQAERLLPLCTACSPAFLCVGIGHALFGQMRVGVLLLIGQTVSALLCGLLFSKQEGTTEEKRPSTARLPSLLDALPPAITDSARTMLSLCATVLFFSALCAPLSLLPPPIGGVLCGILELTAGVRAVSALPFAVTAALLGFFCGFGGLCVAMQVRTVSGGALSLRLYLWAKLLQGILCAILCGVGAWLFF